MSSGTDLEVCLLLFSRILRAVMQLSSEVVVGAQCGSAVLRGAHVFVPGIVASPKRKTQTLFIKGSEYACFFPLVFPSP